MAAYTANFETGVNGNPVLTSDPGSATALSSIADPANVAITYSNVQKHDTLSAVVTNDATGGLGYFGWGATTISPAFSGTHYGRAYMFTAANPGGSTFIVRGLSGARAWELILLATGIIIARDQGGATRCTFTTAIALNQWIRLEWKVVQSTTDGVLEIKLFNSADSPTPTETQTSSGSFSTLADTNEVRFGSIATAVPNCVIYWDDVEINDTGYPGPVAGPVVYTSPNFAPVIYGRGAC